MKLPTAGSVLVGDKGTLLIPHVAGPRLFVEGKESDKNLESVKGGDHYLAWADACRGIGSTGSNFDYAGNLTEAVLLGSIAIRVPGKKLLWDSTKLAMTGSDLAAALVKKTYRKGWEPARVS